MGNIIIKEPGSNGVLTRVGLPDNCALNCGVIGGSCTTRGAGFQRSVDCPLDLSRDTSVPFEIEPVRVPLTFGYGDSSTTFYLAGYSSQQASGYIYIIGMDVKGKLTTVAGNSQDLKLSDDPLVLERIFITARGSAVGDTWIGGLSLGNYQVTYNLNYYVDYGLKKTYTKSGTMV